jgi:hypothetical protein
VDEEKTKPKFLPKTKRRRTAMTEYEADQVFWHSAGLIKGLVEGLASTMKDAQLLGKPHSAMFCLLGDKCPTKDNHLPPYQPPEKENTNGVPESGLPDGDSLT